MDGYQGPNRPIHAVRIIPLVTLGARTNLGGTVTTATSEFVVDGVPLATVGDTVHHPKYGDTTITTGCEAVQSANGALACAGSLTGREDEFIVDAGQCHAVAIEYSDGQIVIGTVNPHTFASDGGAA